ncbi:hypothetical protein BDR05DRAFT_1022846 [Suillus weaverae]|nr:hypothetical protein BDR05DRAFT_1022846 [Suillus weaverae]
MFCLLGLLSLSTLSFGFFMNSLRSPSRLCLFSLKLLSCFFYLVHGRLVSCCGNPCFAFCLACSLVQPLLGILPPRVQPFDKQLQLWQSPQLRLAVVNLLLNFCVKFHQHTSVRSRYRPYTSTIELHKD